MILRTLLVFHLVLTTLELIRTQCAESPCSLLHSRSPFVPLSLTSLCVNLVLHPLGDVLAGLVKLVLGLLRAAARFTLATVPVLWNIYRASGEEFLIFIGGITGTVRAPSRVNCCAALTIHSYSPLDFPVHSVRTGCVAAWCVQRES